jgi:hypothetical protein
LFVSRVAIGGGVGRNRAAQQQLGGTLGPMEFRFPEYAVPRQIDAQRAWTATFESYDQRNDDVYYVVTIHEGARQVGSFMVQVWLSWAGDDWRRPDFEERLRQDIHEVAATGKTNTSYLGAMARRNP